MDEVIDIVVTTYNRLDLLKKTLEHIYSRTRYPHRIMAIDDASQEDNALYLLREWQVERIHDLLMRGDRCGIMGNSNAGAGMTFSDPVVFVDDDMLCPDVEPCWLERLITAMDKWPDLGLLALNHPGARRNSYELRDGVVLCKYVGGTFMAMRRKFLNQYQLPHQRGNVNHCNTQFRSQSARRLGWKVGYLQETFCYHMGRVGAGGHEYKGHFIEPMDWKTLRPPEEWIWRPSEGT